MPIRMKQESFLGALFLCVGMPMSGSFHIAVVDGWRSTIIDKSNTMYRF